MIDTSSEHLRYPCRRRSSHVRRTWRGAWSATRVWHNAKVDSISYEATFLLTAFPERRLGPGKEPEQTLWKVFGVDRQSQRDGSTKQRNTEHASTTLESGSLYYNDHAHYESLRVLHLAWYLNIKQSAGRWRRLASDILTHQLGRGTETRISLWSSKPVAGSQRQAGHCSLRDGCTGRLSNGG